jgi:uncharacterized protein (DUF433 family)
MLNWRRRIASDPKVMVGKPVVAGTRITVECILEHLAAGYTVGELLEQYPRLEADDVQAALLYSGTTVRSLWRKKRLKRRTLHKRPGGAVYR